MFSQGLGVYYMANQNTSIGKYPEDVRSGTNGELQTLTAVPNDFSIQISIYRTSSNKGSKPARLTKNKQEAQMGRERQPDGLLAVAG